MVNKKLLLWICILSIIIIPVVLADTTSSERLAYWDFNGGDSQLTDEWLGIIQNQKGGVGLRAGSTIGYDFTIDNNSNHLNSSYLLDVNHPDHFYTNSTAISFPLNRLASPGNNMSYTAWVNVSGVCGGVSRYIIMLINDAHTQAVGMRIDGTNNFGAGYEGPNGYVTSSGTNYCSQKMYFVVYTYNSTDNKQRLYVNGTEVANQVRDGAYNDWSGTNSRIIIGSGTLAGANQWNGTIDEVRIYNTTLSPSFIANMYVTGTETNGSIIPPAINDTISLSVYTKNIYSNTSILGDRFNITLWNSTHTLTNSTDSGEAKFYNISGNYFLNITSSIYFNRTLPSTYMNNTHYIDVYKTIIYIYGKELITNKNATKFNISANKQFNTSNIDGIAILYVDSGNVSINITFGSGSYYNLSSDSMNLVNLNTYNFSVYFYNSFLNITAINNISRVSINSFTLNVTTELNLTYDKQFNTSLGWILIPCINGSYNLTIDSGDFSFNSTNITVPIGYRNYTFSLMVANAFDFRFYYMLNKVLANNIIVYLELISTYGSANYSTANGTLVISLLTPANYTIRYNSIPNGYPQLTYYYYLQNKTYNQIYLYMMNLTDSSEVTITVVDESNNALEGARIKVLRYDIFTNSYLLQEMIDTDFSGKGVVHLQLKTELYKFLVEYKDTSKLTESAYIYETALTIQLLTSSSMAKNFYNTLPINWDLAYNNQTYTIRYAWNDPDGVVLRGCLDLYLFNLLNEETLINTTCIVGSSGIIYVGIDNITDKTYRASASVYLDDTTKYFLNSIIIELKETIENSKFAGFIIILLMMTVIGIGTWAIDVGIGAMIFVLTVGIAVKFINLSTEIALGLIVLWIIIAYILSKRDT